MKRSNLEVGLRVILKKDTLGRGLSEFIGQEFTIDTVERREFDGEITVAIDGPLFIWCSHRDLKRVKEEAPQPAERPFKVGDKVRVLANPEDLFPVGTIGTITRDDGAEDELPFRVEAGDDSWLYHERDLELYVEEIPTRRIGQKFRVTADMNKYHRLSAGDVVTLCSISDTAGGHRYRRDSDGLEQWLLDAQAEPVADAEPARPEDKVPEVGALFVVTGCTTPGHCFAVGTVVRRAVAEASSCGNFCYEGGYGIQQFVNLSDLKPLSLADIQAALDNQRAPEQGELPWPWPKGTPADAVNTEYTECRMRRNGIPLGTPLFIGSDGTEIPPLETAEGKRVRYVCRDDVVLRK